MGLLPTTWLGEMAIPSVFCVWAMATPRIYWFGQLGNKLKADNTSVKDLNLLDMLSLIRLVKSLPTLT